MDSKLIFWIIGLIIYFWIRSNKSSGNPEQKTAESQTSKSNRRKPTSFEELLREIEAEKSPEEPYHNTETRKEESVLGDEGSRGSRQTEEVINPVYENAKAEAFNRPSLEETLKLETTDVSYQKFKEYDKSDAFNLAAEIGNDLKDTEKIRKAFILNEVLNRKWS